MAWVSSLAKEEAKEEAREEEVEEDGTSWTCCSSSSVHSFEGPILKVVSLHAESLAVEVLPEKMNQNERVPAGLWIGREFERMGQRQDQARTLPEGTPCQ